MCVRPKMSMKTLLHKLLREQRGAAFIEFAMVFPFLFLLLFGGVELARYVLIMQRVEKAAYVITDIAGQESPATDPVPAGAVQISVDRVRTEIFPQFTRLMGVFGNEARQTVVLSSVINTPTRGLRLRWQQVSDNILPGITSIVTGSGPTNTSGSACADAPFPGVDVPLPGTMTYRENMIVGEVFYDYRPIVTSLLGVTQVMPTFTGGGFGMNAQIIAKRLFLHPRNGDLVDLPPAHPVNTDPDIYPCE